MKAFILKTYKRFCALFALCTILCFAYAEDYNAYLGLQITNDTGTTFRQPFNDPQYGVSGNYVPADYDYASSGLLYIPNYSDSDFPVIHKINSIQNAVLSESGTYTLSIDGLNMGDKTEFNQLFISTDIPKYKAYISSMTASFDNVEVFCLQAENTGEVSDKNGLRQYENADSPDYVCYDIINIYNAELDSFQYTFPQKIEIEFSLEFIENAAPSPTPDSGSADDVTTDSLSATPTPDIGLVTDEFFENSPTAAPSITAVPSASAQTDTTVSSAEETDSNSYIGIYICIALLAIIAVTVLILFRHKQQDK